MFEGLVTGDRLAATARYANGASCDFDVQIAFGVGEPSALGCRP